MLSSTLIDGIDGNDQEVAIWNLESASAPPEDGPIGYVCFGGNNANPTTNSISGSQTSNRGRNGFAPQSQRRVLGESNFSPVLDRLYRLAETDLIWGSSSSSPTKHAHHAQQHRDECSFEKMQTSGVPPRPTAPLQSIENKATFSQCLFNMANILMVGRKIDSIMLSQILQLTDVTHFLCIIGNWTFGFAFCLYERWMARWLVCVVFIRLHHMEDFYIDWASTQRRPSTLLLLRGLALLVAIGPGIRSGSPFAETIAIISRNCKRIIWRHRMHRAIIHFIL
jgi:hypothetical protein